MQYPTNARVVRVMCTASVSPHFVLRALQDGIDGVFIGGCRIGDCHYLSGNLSARKRASALQQLLGFCGMDERRIKTHWGSSAEAPELVAEMKEFVHTLKELGPSPLRNPGKTAEQVA